MALSVSYVRPDRVTRTGVIAPYPIRQDDPVALARNTIVPFVRGIRPNGPMVSDLSGLGQARPRQGFFARLFSRKPKRRTRPVVQALPVPPGARPLPMMPQGVSQYSVPSATATMTYRIGPPMPAVGVRPHKHRRADLSGGLGAVPAALNPSAPVRAMGARARRLAPVTAGPRLTISRAATAAVPESGWAFDASRAHYAQNQAFARGNTWQMIGAKRNVLRLTRRAGHEEGWYR